MQSEILLQQCIHKKPQTKAREEINLKVLEEKIILVFEIKPTTLLNWESKEKIINKQGGNL